MKTAKQRADLTNGSVRDHLIRLSLPMTWGIMVIVSFQVVNTYFLSLLGTDALAAISFTFPVTFFVFSVMIGFSIAMSSVLSRLIGEGNETDLRRVATHGLILVFISSLLLSGIGLIFLDPLFRAMGAPESLMPMIRDYMVTWLAGAALISLPMTGNAALRASGDSLIPALIMTVAGVMNVLLDPILIFGLFGFPRLEVQGAAVATVFSSGCAMVAGLYFIGVRQRMFCSLSSMRWPLFKDSARRLLRIALPAGLANAINPLVNAVIVALLAGTGPAAVAAFGIATRVEALAFVILMGLAVGMGPIIGQNLGAGRAGRVRKTLKLAMWFTAGWSVLVAVVLGIFAKPLAGIFSADPDVIAYTALFFWIVPLSYAGAHVANGWSSAFNAMGRPKRAFLMIAGRSFLLMLPAVWVGYTFFGAAGLFAAMAIVNIISGIAFHIWSWRDLSPPQRLTDGKAAVPID